MLPKHLGGGLYEMLPNHLGGGLYEMLPNHLGGGLYEMLPNHMGVLYEMLPNHLGGVFMTCSPTTWGVSLWDAPKTRGGLFQSANSPCLKHAMNWDAIGRDRFASSGGEISSAGSRIISLETIDQTETGTRWLTMFTFLRRQYFVACQCHVFLAAI